MKSIVCTYPDFRTLPKGLRQMLVVSETHFFSEVQVAPEKTEDRKSETKFWWRPPAQFAATNKTALSVPGWR